MNLTKKSLPVLVFACAALAAGGSSLLVGCAGSPTKESTGEYVDDSTITAKVKAALIHDPTVKAGEVSVETFKGVVQLSGFVATSTEKVRAGEVAAGVSGVKDVKNNITIK
ncbi:MAG TPA: BON domain-containing protein [Opitutaceae bacterium]|nr:BON domain-containing protein [Opitutaceae bacterium]